MTKTSNEIIFHLFRDVAQLAEHSLWERGVAGSSPVIPTCMEEVMEKKDNLPNIIALISIILFLIFVFNITRPTEPSELQGGDIEKAIQTEQYR